MDPSLRALVAAAERANWMDELAASRPRCFSAELDRRGLFLRVGRVEAYLCTEADRAWSFRREPGGFDLKAGRLHLVVGKVPPSASPEYRADTRLAQPHARAG